MPTYEMRVTVEYDALEVDSGDRYGAIIEAIDNIPGARVTKDEELGEVLRTKGDDYPEI